ncbi:RNA polymerase sigma-70 factor (family 1) [Pedobacter africanus]|uniref:RNA polymerase sigma-70 factor (ECF subfamily) n=1 Tax=Pedobacter africanus TaxID=151894 RepID=A0ACC6L1I8_9SPHI|nr:RNA polymerase sigma-70 factor [Pedobacter africanus]MDR6785219.1 RNA polymerase sigma-70 factor (ECF subfamily) [Pedobacter africanus]
MATGVRDFKQLYLDFYAALCYFAFNIVGDQDEAEDIVEDVFLKLLHGKQKDTADENIRAYLYTATRNSCLNHIKTSTRAKERQWQYNAELPAEEQAWVNQLIKAEVLREIMIEIDKLPGHTGKIIRMSYFEGMKNEEISEILGISMQTVKNLKSKGISSLRSCLKPEVFALFMLVYGFKAL